jgi:hypothetical protein
MRKLLLLIIKYAIWEALIYALVVTILLSTKLRTFFLQHGQERITTILGRFCLLVLTILSSQISGIDASR